MSSLHVVIKLIKRHIKENTRHVAPLFIGFIIVPV